MYSAGRGHPAPPGDCRETRPGTAAKAAGGRHVPFRLAVGGWGSVSCLIKLDSYMGKSPILHVLSYYKGYTCFEYKKLLSSAWVPLLR